VIHTKADICFVAIVIPRASEMPGYKEAVKRGPPTSRVGGAPRDVERFSDPSSRPPIDQKSTRMVFCTSQVRGTRQRAPTRLSKEVNGTLDKISAAIEALRARDPSVVGTCCAPAGAEGYCSKYLSKTIHRRQRWFWSTR